LLKKAFEAVILSMHIRKQLSVMSGRRRETGAIDPLKAMELRAGVWESAPSLSCWARSLHSLENHPMPVIPAKAGIQLDVD